MDKQNVVEHIIFRILLGNKEECSTDTRDNMDEPWKHYAVRKKPDTKHHILHDSTYIKYPD